MSQADMGMFAGAASARTTRGRKAVPQAMVAGIAISLVALCLGAAIYLLIERTIARTVEAKAASAAKAWATYFAKTFHDLDQVLDTGTLTPQQKEFVAASENVGQVFRFRLFDSRGRLVLASDETHKAPVEPSLRDHNPEAVKAIETGNDIISVEEGLGDPNWPALYAEAYLPVRADTGELLGIVEVYVDQTATQALFTKAFYWVALVITGVIMLAFLVPAIGFALRNAQAKRAAEQVARIETDARLAAEAQAAELARMNETITALNRDMAQTIRQLNEAQDELQKKGKMAQLGQLIATVAHELRNPLAAVRTSAFLLERRVKDKGLGIEAQLERIGSGVTRCDDIISQLLDFSRTKPVQPVMLALDDWLAKLVEDEAQKLPELVDVECSLGLGELQVPFDPARLSRAVINLMNNASEALVGKAGMASPAPVKSPRISISTRATQRGVELRVADNGPGIAAEHLAKIFEPLFTTKSFGTGLGLPAVQKIMEQHAGGLEVTSEPGKGAAFTAWWPIAQQLKEAS